MTSDDQATSAAGLCREWPASAKEPHVANGCQNHWHTFTKVTLSIRVLIKICSRVVKEFQQTVVLNQGSVLEQVALRANWQEILERLGRALRRSAGHLQHGFLFPTCQVRVVRFYHSCSSSFLPSFLPSSLLPSSPIFIANLHRQASSPICFANLLRRSCLASSRSQCAPLDLNRKDPSAVCTPGPQPQGSPRSVHPCRTSTARSERSVHPWTSTARIRAQCAPLDLNCKDPLAVCTPGPQPQGSDRSVHPWTSTARIRSQCAVLDLNRKDPIAVCTAGPQPQGSDRSVHRWTSTR